MTCIDCEERAKSIARMTARLSIDAACPCCGQLRACFAGCTFAADEIEHLRARVDELHSQPCSDCGAPSEPATLCSSCATSRCIELGIMAAAEQRKRDADICRQIHSTSRQRVELALLCAEAIEGAGQ